MNNKILQAIHEGNLAQAREALVKENVVDIAYMLEDQTDYDILMIFRLLPKEMTSEVFAHMSPERQRYIVESVTDQEASAIVDDLYMDDTMDFIEEMPANVVKKILRNTDPERRALINLFLAYPEDSAGSIMTVEYVDLKKSMTVAEALAYIKRRGVDRETIDTCFVMDEKRVLEGYVTLRKLVLSDGDELVENLMESDAVYVNTHDDQEDIAQLFKRYDYLVAPVVDNENRLVGIVTIDDILDVIEQENTEDMQKMAAMQPNEREYLRTSALTLARHRIPWLMVLMVSATLTGAIIQHYETTLQSVTILAAFIPMLMDTGGNAGSQSSTLIIRGLALEEIRMQDIIKVIWKEFKVSIIVGAALAAVNFVRIMIFESVSPLIAFTVSITILFTVILAKIVGGTMPILAKKLNFDPAIMAGPLITTLVDGLALFVYFTFATSLLGI